MRNPGTTPSPLESGEASFPGKDHAWIVTFEGRTLTAATERARQQLRLAVKAGKVLERTIAGATPGSIEDIRNRRSNLVAINQLSDRPPFSVKDQRLVDYQILTGIKVTFGDQIDFQDAREDALRRKFRNLWLKALCTQITDMPAELQILIFQAAAGSLDKGSQPSSTLEFSIVKDVDLLRGQSPPHNNVFDFEIFNLSAHGAFVAHELAHEIARQSGRSKFSLSLEHVDIEDFLGRDRGLNTRYITLRAADFIHRVECDIWETELEADHEDNFRIWSLLDALLYLPAGKHVMITLLFVRDNSDCLNCGQNCYDGNSRHPHSRPVVELAHLYRKLRPVCERLERISNTGVEVELRWSRYRPLLYGKASPKSLGFCEAVKIVLDAYRASARLYAKRDCTALPIEFEPGFPGIDEETLCW